jgi:F0F1-type ATP synthase beta subunit
MESKTSLSNLGVVVSVRGSVVDIRFDEHLPPIYSVLRAGRKGESSSKCWRSVMRVTCAGLR